MQQNNFFFSYFGVKSNLEKLTRGTKVVPVIPNNFDLFFYLVSCCRLKWGGCILIVLMANLYLCI